MGPDRVSVQSNFMQFDTQDLPGWKHTKREAHKLEAVEFLEKR